MPFGGHVDKKFRLGIHSLKVSKILFDLVGSPKAHKRFPVHLKVGSTDKHKLYLKLRSLTGEKALRKNLGQNANAVRGS